MKLRFEQNSIRYRIRKTELTQLKQVGLVKEIISFVHATFTYELRVENVDQIDAELLSNTVIVHIPLDLANTFFQPDEVGIYKHIQLSDNQTLDIVIEKDFPCKEGPEQEIGDKFSELAKKEGTDEVC